MLFQLLYALLIAIFIYYGIRNFALDYILCNYPCSLVPGIPSLEKGDAFLTLYRSNTARDQAMEQLEAKSQEGQELGLLQMPLISRSVVDALDVEYSKQIFSDHCTAVISCDRI